MDTKPKNEDDIQPLTPEEIKAIGEIAVGPSRHEVFLNQHYRKLMWGGISLSLVAGVVIAYFSHKNDMRMEAAAQVVQAMKVAAPGATVSAAEYDAPTLQQLRAEYAATPSAETASLLEGLSLLAKGEEAAAVALLEQLASGSANVLLQSRALAALATHYLSTGKEAESRAAWQRVTELGDTPYTALAYITLGDMCKSAGERDAARAFYEQASAKCATSTLVTGKVVEMRLMLLDVDAPRAVAPAPAPVAPAAPESNSSEPFGAVPGVQGAGGSLFSEPAGL